MLSSIVSQVSFIALFGATVVALSVGDRWVKLAALLHATNWVLVALLQDHEHPIFQARDFVVDVIGAALASVIAVRSAAVWAASLASSEWLGVLTRVAPLVDATIHRRATITAEYLWEGGALISLAAGAFHSRRVGARRASLAR